MFSQLLWWEGWSDFREVFDPGSSKQRRGDSQTKRLVGYVEESGAELWKTRWRQASISFPLGNGTANVPLDASEAEDYLRLSLWQKERIPATATVIRDVLATLRAKAIYEGETYEAPVRVAAVGEERWLDPWR
ncbi:hypothetical protein [Candidatus Amarobacter glycogenicus]|uniref:hypothetical protein n=1 Tax=Candidatus Amarobacter glycogenicus TaxID=3140699 RepID=UPI0031361F46|nr:hypothetical protein [Dehalococcoidia bacterium]